MPFNRQGFSAGNRHFRRLLSPGPGRQLGGWFAANRRNAGWPIAARGKASGGLAHCRRYEAIARRIDQTLAAAAAGLLLVNERHQAQFPADIEVFYIAPPALDEYRRWLQNWAARLESAATAAADMGADSGGNGSNGGDDDYGDGDGGDEGGRSGDDGGDDDYGNGDKAAGAT